MKTVISAITLFVLVSLANPAAADNPRVQLDTDLGIIVIELFAKEAPVSVANFLQYVNDGFYEGTQFHRVIPGFMVQGGGLTFDFNKKPTRDPIKNESDNGLKNLKGTLALARTSEPNSATSQFFINIADNPSLDYEEGKWGYAVFGKVIEGMDVVESIVKEPRGRFRLYPDAPNASVRILRAQQLKK